MEITVYSKDHCPFCDQAIALATRKGYDVKVLKLGVDFDMRKMSENFPWARSFPQIKAGEEYIGGFDEFKMWVDK